MKLYVIAGRPCSGKTTFAYNIGNRNNIEVMYLDVFANEEAQKATTDKPELYKWKTMDLVDILQDNPKTLLKDYLSFYRELFPLFLDFLRNKTTKELIIESAMLLPQYVKLLEEEFDTKAVYLRSSDDFVKDVYPKRDYAIEMMKTKKGKTALKNLLERDSLFATKLYADAEKIGYTVMNIKNTHDFDVVFPEVEKFLGFSPQGKK